MWYVGKQRSEIFEGGVGEEGAAEGKTSGDAEELGEEHEGDAVRHFLHISDAQDDGEASLQIASNTDADEDLKPVQVGVG